jgi:hypothetical protein
MLPATRIACDHGASGTDAASTYCASGPHDGVDLDAAAHLQRPGEHDRIGVDTVDAQYRIGGAELVEQPAGVVDPAVPD